jgi:hypothetical protein
MGVDGGSVGTSVGGSLVAVGGSEVGGSVVAVGGSLVAVGGIEVAVGGIAVTVGGTDVFVGGGRGVFVGGGFGVAVEGILGGRVLVGGGLVELEIITGTVTVGEAVGVLDGRRMGVDSMLMLDNACTVSAETVLILLTAKSTILAGSRTMGVVWFGSERAMAEVIHNKLIPRIPAATTPSRLV